MKKFVTLILLASSLSAQAQPGFRYHHHHGYYPGYNYGWVAPTIIGGMIGYEMARNYPPVVVQQPVIVQQAPATVYYGQTQACTEWIEIQQPDGTITRTRTCRQ